MSIDIHNYALMYQRAENCVRISTISDRNKQLIFSYRDACLLQQTCGKVRLIRALGALTLFAIIMAKDFDTATRDDIQHLLATLLARQPPYSPATIATYKAILKRFYTWLANPDTFSQRSTPPPTVAWITVHLRKKDLRPLERNALLLPEEISRAIATCRNPRDRALIAVLWETGARISEIGNLQIKHVTKAPHGFTLDLNGKTGHRSPMIISSAPTLAQWLADHPFASNPEAPLWVHRTGTAPRHLIYASITRLLERDLQRAGITKHVHPHLFRHSRVTYVLAAGLMNESQAKAYFGWTPDSDMLATYAHLVDADANNAILRENNLAPANQRRDELLPISCRICSEINPAKASYCTRCNAVLDLKKAYEHQQLHDLKEELVTSMFRVMVEKGLIDDAARAVHDAKLGDVLKRLVQHARGERPITDRMESPLPPDVKQTPAT